jgi:hypothetical protein
MSVLTGFLLVGITACDSGSKHSAPPQRTTTTRPTPTASKQKRPSPRGAIVLTDKAGTRFAVVAQGRPSAMARAGDTAGTHSLYVPVLLHNTLDRTAIFPASSFRFAVTCAQNANPAAVKNPCANGKYDLRSLPSDYPVQSVQVPPSADESAYLLFRGVPKSQSGVGYQIWMQSTAQGGAPSSWTKVPSSR